MRQIVLDTETTGIDPNAGHRIIEIGCVEVVERKLTGRNYHVYINPEREVEAETDGLEVGARGAAHQPRHQSSKGAQLET